METLVLENEEKTTWQLIQKGISKAISYPDYRNLVAELAKQGLSTAPVQTEALGNYTLLNDKRMKRLDKTLKIDEETLEKIKAIDQKVTWLVLTESWCGDAAQTIPMMHKIAALNDNISLKIIFRDEHSDLMNHFLTNNALSIPKLIAVDETNEDVIGAWGPRPSIANDMVAEYKEVHGKLTAGFKSDLQQWYNKDKGKNMLQDMAELLALE